MDHANQPIDGHIEKPLATQGGQRPEQIVA